MPDREAATRWREAADSGTVREMEAREKLTIRGETIFRMVGERDVG
jgi:hypothetical protein